MIVVVDYGMGNLGSIFNMLKKIGAVAHISSDHHEIELAEKLILPGVGSFDNGMRNLKDKGLFPVLRRKVIDNGTPILGICLGMQLLSRKSEEGSIPGLGWIDADTVKLRFEAGVGLKIPHMGWNTVEPIPNSTLFAGLEEDNRFYFVHSYHIVCDSHENILGQTNYGFFFTSAVVRRNIYGVQFHPEKSHKFGMRLMQNFCFGLTEGS